MCGVTVPAEGVPVVALGMMSGTSLDGVDAALVETDGTTIAKRGLWCTRPYPAALRSQIRALIDGAGERGEAERALTLFHAEVAESLIDDAGIPRGEISLVGFPGHTVFHDPTQRLTDQLGDPALLASKLGIDVVGDFRSNDVSGGVGNVTWIGGSQDADLLAFDTGPGCALLDDWVGQKTGERFDREGRLAAGGSVDETALAALLANPYFAAKPPKSLDRNQFDPTPVAGLSAADGAATLVTFSAEAVRSGLGFLPSPPERWLVTGGGRHNPVLMAALTERLGASCVPVEQVGWDGDALEAQAFGFLAVRSVLGLPLSFPRTTGVPRPLTGGRLYRAQRQ
jgi:anhydro-N-acetylmuramic acid kinase